MKPLSFPNCLLYLIATFTSVFPTDGRTSCLYKFRVSTCRMSWYSLLGVPITASTTPCMSIISACTIMCFCQHSRLQKISTPFRSLQTNSFPITDSICQLHKLSIGSLSYSYSIITINQSTLYRNLLQYYDRTGSA
jgi:hypothetical protein